MPFREICSEEPYCILDIMEISFKTPLFGVNVSGREGMRTKVRPYVLKGIKRILTANGESIW